MQMKEFIERLNNIKNNIYYYDKYSWARDNHKLKILEDIKILIEIEIGKELPIIDDLIDVYEILSNKLEKDILLILPSLNIHSKLEYWIEELSKQCYGSLIIDYEKYKIKTILYYENDNNEFNIAYMAGSFYTDQEYRTFLANIQKGRGRLIFNKVNGESEYDLRTLKNGYLSRVKKAINSNTQDGYHADFHLNDGRFFFVKDNDNPINMVYNWIVENTQAAVLPEWKEYLYNSLIEGGHIIQCQCINYTNIIFSGFVLSEEVNTELIRDIRKEGLDTKEICIPREPVELDPSMSFIDAMTQFVIPEITQRETLYTIGDEFSKIIESPIIFKKNYSLVKSTLFPKQKVIAQGLLNSIKNGRNNLILNGGMGIGKTYISIKLAYATIKEHFKTDNGRIAIYCQSHLLPKWERQFKEALPNVPLKFIRIEGYKDVLDIPEGKPNGIEVYLLPKDKVKRKYLEEFSSRKKIYTLSKKSYDFLDKATNVNNKNIFIANNVPISNMKVIARKLEKIHKTWICVAKEVFDEDGNIVGYKVATNSNTLKNKFGKSGKAYDFFIEDLNSISYFKEEILEEYSDKNIKGSLRYTGLTCSCCGGLIYNSPEEQFSEDDYCNFIHNPPKSKTNKNKKCNNYIKVDGTPLTSFERNLLIKGELDYIIDEDIKTPYLDSDHIPINDYEILQEIKRGRYKHRYTIALKKCDSPLWTAIDRKGYRAVNSIDMIKRKFGKNFFTFLIADESHLYSAESSQGETFAKLCRMSKVNLALTGTLTGGKASHLFYTLYRMIPHKMSKYYKYNEVSKFIDHYGRRKKITKEYKNNDKYNKSGQGKVSSSGWSEIPGISPLLFSHFLSDIMVSRKIEDMDMKLPELSFYKHRIEMSPELKKGYDKLKDDILRFIKDNKHLNLGGTYLNALLSYPDIPLTEPLMYDNEVISNPLSIDIENIVLPKEQKLIETVKREIQQGRRSVIYVTFTGTKTVDRRLEKILTDAGIKVSVLKSSVATEKREKWIEDRYKEGVEVIITNPKLVQTGLDIIDYPTMYFYELDYDVRVIRQAESRAWRPGQENQCRVYYSYYDNTLQFDSLKLIGSKKKASLALEGVFAEDILSDMGDVGDSGVSALYKSLLGKVKLKEDDLDFFSEEKEISTIPDKTPILKDFETNHTTYDRSDNTSQLSLFTITNEVIRKTKKKKTISIGQISLFEF